MPYRENEWPLRWDLLLRYRLIEVISLWEGRLTTNHLQRAFGIGRQQASKDINTYIAQFAPRNLSYDGTLKGYTPTKYFKPVFTQGIADEYLHMMHAREDLACSFEALAVRELNTVVLRQPARALYPEILRPILQACRERKRVEIYYASLSSPDPEYRVIQPHTVVHTGFRWHVRAWCERRSEYRDFVLSRIIEPPQISLPADHGQQDDPGWQTVVKIKLVPHPGLSKPQQRVIKRDFGMQRGQLVIETRGALVSYVLHQLRVDSRPDERQPESQQIVIGNLEEVEQWWVV